MKKILCSMLLVLLIIISTVTCCLAAEDDYFIYRYSLFDEHKVGEKPSAFVYHPYNYNYPVEWEHMIVARENTEIVQLEKDGNSDNLAVKISADTEKSEVEGVLRNLFLFYPIQGDGVISFSFRVDDFSVERKVDLNVKVSASRNLYYTDTSNYCNFIKIKGDDVYFNDKKLIASDIAVDTWYRIDFVFNVDTRDGTLYFDGKPTTVTLPTGTREISEVAFKIPKSTTGEESSWYIDDLRIYQADKVVDDEILDALWKKYTDSSFYAGYEFESHRVNMYDYMAFRKCEGKKFLVINSDKMFDGSQVVDIPAPLYTKDDGTIMAPVRFIAESYGAKVDWDDARGSVIISCNGNTLDATPGENIFYVNGQSSKLHYPVELVDGVACMNLDILFEFIDKEYYLRDDFLWLDEANEFDWHMPLADSGVEMKNLGGATIEDGVYDSIFRTYLFSRPSDEEIDTAMKTYSPDNMHPRLLFTAETVAETKEGIKKDSQLKSVVDNIIKSADGALGAPDVKYGLYDGVKTAHVSTVGLNLEKLAFGYLFCDDEEKKAAYKAEMWHHIAHLDNTEIFPDWQVYTSSALSHGTGAYGFAYAYDWVDWTDEERTLMVNMWKRNVFDEMLHAYNCSTYGHHHSATVGSGNQNLVTNGGFALLAVAMYDEDPEYFQDVIRGTLLGLEGGFLPYFPKGEYDEGISYWNYAGGKFPEVLKGLQTAMGTDWGITDVPGVLETASFPFRMRGAVSGYAFGDGQAQDAIISLLMFVADQTDNKSLAQYRKEFMGQSGNVSDVANWVYDTAEHKQGLGVYGNDIYSKSNETYILKTGWTKADTTVAFHGGAASDGHGHLDMGSVQFDISGVRFGMDMPRENYNLRNIGHYDATRQSEFYPKGYNFGQGHYYRLKGEGHNTVVANRQYTNMQDPELKYYDMKGGSEFVKSELSDISSFVLLDMTDTNDIYQSGIRGVKLDKISNTIEIQDDFIAKRPTDFMWSMHTYADIEIAEDGKSAILTYNKQQVKATILNDCDFKFEVMPTVFDETYGTIAKPKIETPNFVYGKDHPFYQTHQYACDIRSEARKLVVRTKKGEDIKHFKLAVTFQPYIEGNTAEPEYVSMELWENKAVKRQYLASIMVDGEPLAEFDPEKNNYSVLVVTEKSDIPEVTAIATNTTIDVETIKATSVPGITSIILKQNGMMVGQYIVLISPINNTEKFHSDKQLPIYAYQVSAEPETENNAGNLFDGDFTTKFATNEMGGNVIMDLGSVIEGNLKLGLACANGNTRKENFKIEYSVDGINYTEAFNGQNSGTTTGLEKFDICNGKARYVRVSFYGNSQGSAWISATEMFVSNE